MTPWFSMHDYLAKRKSADATALKALARPVLSAAGTYIPVRWVASNEVEFWLLAILFNKPSSVPSVPVLAGELKHAVVPVGIRERGSGDSDPAFHHIRRGFGCNGRVGASAASRDNIVRVAIGGVVEIERDPRRYSVRQHHNRVQPGIDSIVVEVSHVGLLELDIGDGERIRHPRAAVRLDGRDLVGHVVGGAIIEGLVRAPGGGQTNGGRPRSSGIAHYRATVENHQTK